MDAALIIEPENVAHEHDEHLWEFALIQFEIDKYLAVN